MQSNMPHRQNLKRRITAIGKSQLILFDSRKYASGKSEVIQLFDAAGIELAALSNMCLTLHISDKGHLRREVEAYNTRNAKATPVNGRFTSQDTCHKIACLHPRFLRD